MKLGETSGGSDLRWIHLPLLTSLGSTYYHCLYKQRTRGCISLFLSLQTVIFAHAVLAEMAPSDFKNANIDEVVEQLTTDEAILLTAGVGFWHTHGVPRLNVPAIKVSDGPNGMLIVFFVLCRRLI